MMNHGFWLPAIAAWRRCATAGWPRSAARERLPANLVALLLVVSATASAATARTVALYDVRRAEAPPVIDGKLDDPCWQRQPVITDMVLRGSATRVPAQVQTRTTLLYDDKALYVGIHLNEPNPKGLLKNYVQYDGDLWWDDSVELYIETGCSHQEYFKLMSNALGTRADWRGKNTPMGFQMFNWGTGAEWTVAAHTGADFWSLEFRIPWSDLEVMPPKPGDVWTFEVVRFRYAEGQQKKEYSSWNVGATHDKPGAFGNIVFSGTTAEMEKIMTEKLKPVVGGAIKVYGREGELRFTDYATLKQERDAAARDMLRNLHGKLEGLAKTLEAKTRETLQAQIAEREKKLDELAGRPASAATAEALDKLLEDCAGVLWTIRYHELNASLPAADAK